MRKAWPRSMRLVSSGPTSNARVSRETFLTRKPLVSFTTTTTSQPSKHAGGVTSKMSSFNWGGDKLSYQHAAMFVCRRASAFVFVHAEPFWRPRSGVGAFTGAYTVDCQRTTESYYDHEGPSGWAEDGRCMHVYLLLRQRGAG